MNPSRAFSIVGVSAAVAGAGVAVALAASPAKITASGAGGVTIGASYKSLHDKGLIGKIKHGCELGGPKTRAARLKKPLFGSVDFTLNKPRKVSDIQLEGGAKARGVGVGATVSQIKAKFPKAKVNHSIEDTVGLTLVKIPKSEGGKFTFGVSTETKQTVVIGIPNVAICD